MTKRSTTKTVRALANSALTQKDADNFKVAAKKYAASATTSKRKAQNKLISLGIYTATGRLSKHYS